MIIEIGTNLLVAIAWIGVVWFVMFLVDTITGRDQ